MKDPALAMWVAGYDKLFAIGETISSSNFRSGVAFKEVGKGICGISRPTRILIYIAKIKIIKIQVRENHSGPSGPVL